jgi:zinc transporter
VGLGVTTTDSIYGSDKHGIIWAYLFRPGTLAVQLDADGVLAWLQDGAHAHADSFLWLHFSLANAASVRWMRAHLQAPESFYDSLQHGAVSTRVEQEGAALVAAIHDVLFDAEFDSSNVSRMSAYVEPRLLVSARLRPLRSVDQLRAAVRGGAAFRSASELLAQLLREQANVLVDIVRRSTGRVDAVEDTVLASRMAVSRRELGALRRSLVRLQRLLAPEPASLFRLLSRPPSWVGGEDLQDLRQASEEFSAAVADTSALADRVRLLQEELVALTNEQTNRTLFVLTSVTVLALPINLVAGLFGMNVGGIPLAGHGHGFLVVVIILSMMTALLAYLAFGRRGE